MTENVFDVMEKKSKDYYSFLVGKKAQPPNIVHKLQRNFNFSSDQLKHFFILPHRVALESYVKAFQYKGLTSILYTNTKLHKIGFRPNDLCSFCEAQSETLSHIFYQCSYSRQFWTDFESYWYFLSNQRVHLSLENVLYGIITQQCPSFNLLNYFIIIGKLFLWNCRESQINPEITGFKNKIVLKYETERNINNTDYFQKKWVLTLTRLGLFVCFSIVVVVVVCFLVSFFFSSFLVFVFIFFIANL